MRWEDDTLPNEKAEVRPASDSESHTRRSDHRKKLRNMPFTLDTFRLVAKRMSIHSWIGRLISRANVPAFERTLTEMPLYTSTGVGVVRQKAIIYNCRTSNEWENDMALTVTHFPEQKLTFALLFGASEGQERSVLARLRTAGPDTAHPMLLPGILAELERKRQMEIADEMIDELEMQIFQLDNETLTSWKHSRQTTAERNKQKTKAWLDAAFSRNILLTTKSLLFSMRRHLDEYAMLVNPTMRGAHDLRRQDPDHSACKGLRPGTPHSSTSSNWQFCSQMSLDSESSVSETLTTSNPESTCDPDATYQVILQQAGMRMEDRFLSIIAEYDDKIRACSMEVDGMAMATQWSHGETNMEIATATGEDSRQMRSIALVTMIFLPGTFFASMFSMTFFNWKGGADSDSAGDNSGPTVSPEIWIYFLMTASSTMITLLLFWYFILSRQRNRRKSQGDSCPV
ncbi:uncharacterized protein B0H64DRAFT_169712 [Chaetomium fimeti]|uniref:Uncharacterized protein n=1 Tax=Chaetomium fimeti TaxID=1854472 RepID=A0AAE0HH92_9PEZI|nr:hypothetical protein B0H64DRAFT_169712 [Chaetomium fimeti]